MKEPVRVISALYTNLEEFSHDELREYAKRLEVQRGRSKRDTIENLLASGKATICATLGD